MCLSLGASTGRQGVGYKHSSQCSSKEKKRGYMVCTGDSAAAAAAAATVHLFRLQAAGPRACHSRHLPVSYGGRNCPCGGCSTPALCAGRNEMFTALPHEASTGGWECKYNSQCSSSSNRGSAHVRFQAARSSVTNTLQQVQNEQCLGFRAAAVSSLLTYACGAFATQPPFATKPDVSSSA
jgi:hypothetical protein